MIDGAEQFLELYQEYVQAYRAMVECQFRCRAYNAKLLREHGVPAGKAIDYHGDGEVKPAPECAQPPEAI